MEAEGATKKLESLYEHILSKLEWTDVRFVEKYTVIMGALVTLMEPMSASGLANLYSPDGISEADIHRICTYIRPLLQDYSREQGHKPVRLLHLSAKEFLGERAAPPYRLDYDHHHLALSRLSLITIRKHLLPHVVPILGFTEGDWVWNFDGVRPIIPVLLKEDLLEHLWYACRYFGKHELSILRNYTDDNHAKLLYETVVKGPQFILEVCSSIGGVIEMASLRNKAQSYISGPCDMFTIRKTARIYFAIARCMYPQETSLILMEEATRMYRPFATNPTDPAMKFEFATYLCWFGMLLSDRHRSISGGLSLQVMEEALAITHRLATASQNTPDDVLGSLLLLQSLILSQLGRYKDSHQVDINSVEVFRRLEIAHPTKFRGKLAKVLHNAAHNLILRECHDEATPYIVEAIELRRSLARDDPQKYEVPLSESLLNYVVSLTHNGRASNALEFGEEALAIRRRLAAESPSRFHRHLPIALIFVSRMLKECDRHTDAIAISAESVQLCRRLAKHDSAAYEELLAASLHSHSLCLSMAEATWIECVQIGREAVELWRQLALEDPVRFSPVLAESLINLVYNLDRSGCRSDTVPYVLESVDTLRYLAGKEPETYEATFASSLHHYAVYLSKSTATLENSIQFGQETVSIRRRLAHRNPQLNAEYAWSLFNLAWDLDSGNRTSEAVPISLESIHIYRRLAEEDPKRYQSSLATSLHRYAFYLSKSSITLKDSILPAREAISSRRLLFSDQPGLFGRDLAHSLINLASTLTLCGQHLDAAPLALQSVEIRRGLASEDPTTDEASLAESLHVYALSQSQSPKTLPDSIPPAQEAVDIRRRLALANPQEFEEKFVQSLNNLALFLTSSGQTREAIPAFQELAEIRRRLVEKDPTDEHLHDFAVNLRNHSICSSIFSSAEDSVAPMGESVGILRRLISRDPSRFEPVLAYTLFSLAGILGDCSHFIDGISVSQEAVGMYRRLVEKDRATYEPDLGLSLINLAWCLAHHSGHENEALLSAEESLTIHRRLSLADRTKSEQGLAIALGMVAFCLNVSKRYKDALTVVIEGFAKHRQAAQEMYPQLLDRQFSGLHRIRAESLIGLGIEKEAITPLQEAVVIYRRLLDGAPTSRFYDQELQYCTQLLDRVTGGLIS
ncbi:hypothetical protein FA15DRAFT_671267 [Coprinopsis marcescibilis]|uniref:TPR-like protein n=1 Tax=Coprinopsis marcescibilis TaxID=230819 RepID=A0A5C3KQ47_COPMA|nr:hypothetical protein FA15DRAFT_671267 [Coprinopsis marcescibilis]